MRSSHRHCFSAMRTQYHHFRLRNFSAMFGTENVVRVSRMPFELVLSWIDSSSTVCAVLCLLCFSLNIVHITVDDFLYQAVIEPTLSTHTLINASARLYQISHLLRGLLNGEQGSLNGQPIFPLPSAMARLDYAGHCLLLIPAILRAGHRENI